MRPLFFENYTQVDIVLLAAAVVVVVVVFNIKSTVVRTGDKQNCTVKLASGSLFFFHPG